MTDDIWQWSAVRTATAIRNKTVSCEEVITAHVERMRNVNPVLNAVVADFGDEAVLQAREADSALARGDELDVLHGLPVTIKDNVDIKGHISTNGVDSASNVTAPSDAPIVRNLKNAGAIPICTTATPEYSLRICTASRMYGLTLNPWDHAISCGGSSGGAAASLAAGVGVIAHGNDLGGSLRVPAHCNGVVSIRPTAGRVPNYKETAPAERGIAHQLFATQGPLARSVEDTRLALSVMARPDSRDPWWVPAPLEMNRPKSPIRVAVAKVPAGLVPNPAVMAQYRLAQRYLLDEGYELEEVELPDLPEISYIWNNILLTELRLMQEEAMRNEGSEDFLSVLDAHLQIAEPLDHHGYATALGNRTYHLRRWMELLETYPVILTPMLLHGTFGPTEDAHGPSTVKEMFYENMYFVGPINYLGLPSVAVPVGTTKGHPIGVQLISSRYREDLALDAAEAIERSAGLILKELWDRMG